MTSSSIMSTLRVSDRLVSVLLLCVPLLAAGASVAEAQKATETERLMALLRETSKVEHVSGKQLQQSLSAFGPEVIPVLFAVMDTGIIPSGRSATVLSPKVLDSLWAAFDAYPPSAIREHLTRFAKPQYGERTRLNAVRLLGGVGNADDLSLLGRLAAPPESTPSEALRVAFGYSVASIFERDASAVYNVKRAYTDCHASLRPKLLERIGRASAADKLSVLSGLLSLVPSSDIHVLRAITELASAGRGTTDEYVCSSVRPYLIHTDAFLVQAATQALGALRDEDSIEALIDLMEHGDARTSPLALVALTKISGHGFGAQPTTWRNWYESELNWWRFESAQVFADLRHSDPGRVATALRELSPHSLYREELATAVLSVLDRREDSLRRMACITLGNLGAEGARNRVKEHLDDPAPDVRAAAKEAMSKLTYRIVSRN